MDVKELKSILENVPGDVEVTVWANAVDCCHRIESAFYIVTNIEEEEIRVQLALFENWIKFEDLVIRGFTIASSTRENRKEKE